MAIWHKLSGDMRKLLAKMLAVFVLLLPAPGVMAMQCNDDQMTIVHHATDVSAHVSLKSDHKHGSGKETCCKASCVVCSAVFAPVDSTIHIERSSRKFTATSAFLADLTLPPLLGPPRIMTSTL
ncbi:MAG: hypothetical protein JWM58_4301 [Rhizobium sp.]|nr:hypothetical protein [Rhizobium sp.]